MKKVEYWRWRYRDIATGRICRTMFQVSEAEARVHYVDAERIEGSMTLRELPEKTFVAAGGAPEGKPCLD
jgi:hypothetical protein